MRPLLPFACYSRALYENLPKSYTAPATQARHVKLISVRQIGQNLAYCFLAPRSKRFYSFIYKFSIVTRDAMYAVTGKKSK